MEIKQLGPYKIGKKLGRGGMGTVYAAVDTSTGKRVAVKVLSPNLASEEGFRERFEGEIESLQQLNHPNIVKLFGFGEQTSVLYYAMELVEGSSLEGELANGRRFQWREVCHISIDLCRALKLAHDHGIIHRDIKPANLLWTPGGQVKLADFGIARLFGNTGLTIDGGVLGTVEYMSPEQADGQPVTHHCDLYSLGGVMFALLAGRPPFRSHSVLELLQMLRSSEPNGVRDFAPETPVEMEAIIAQLLEKEPQKRFPNVLMVARNLEAMERGLSLRSEREQRAESAWKMAVEGDAESSENAGSPLEDPAMGLEQAVTCAGDFDVGLDDSVEDQETNLDRFTTIDEAKLERRQAAEEQKPNHPLISAPTWILAIALLLISAVAWYLLQPPPADQLHQQIMAASGGDEQRLLEIENEVAEFLKHYPDDPRAQSVRDIKQQLQILHLERRAKSQARMLNKRYPNSPVGHEYMAAIELADTAPEKAAERLQSIIDLYHQPGQPQSVSVFLDAATRHLPRIERQIKELAEEKVPLLEKRLQEAIEAVPQNPQKAREICRAIVVLYQDKPWAKDVVLRAQETLDKLDRAAGS